MRFVVQLEVGQAQLLALGRPIGVAPQDDAHARDELFQAEWFGDVVVAADGQAMNLLFGRVAGREKDDRHLPTRRGEAAEDLEAIDVRQHDVEDHQSGLEGLDLGQRVTAAERGLHAEALVAERHGDQLGDVQLIVDHQDPLRIGCHLLRIVPLFPWSLLRAGWGPAEPGRFPAKPHWHTQKPSRPGRAVGSRRRRFGGGRSRRPGGRAAPLARPAPPALIDKGLTHPRIALALGVVLVRLPSLSEPRWHPDDGLFTVVAWATSKGVPLYAGVYDNSPPGIYWLYRLLLLLGADRYHLVVQVAAMLAVVAAALLTFEITRQLAPPWPAALAGGLTGFALSVPTLDGDLLNVELAALPLFLAALRLAFTGRLVGAFLAGALLGLAVVTRPSFALRGLALLGPLRLDRRLVAAASGGVTARGAVLGARWIVG